MLSWLKKGVSRDDIIAQGYELEYTTQLGNGNAGNLYQIKNTDVQVEVNDFANNNILSVMSLMAPASLIIPDSINTNVRYINKDGILYIPYGELSMGVRPTKDTGNTITDDTMVAVTSKAMCKNMNMNGWDNWNKVLLDMAYSYDIAKDVERRYGEEIVYPYFEISATVGNTYLVSDKMYSNNMTVFYKLNVETGAFSFVCGIPYITDVNLSDYPEYFSEFIN